jgi:hypothetical protein
MPLEVHASAPSARELFKVAQPGKDPITDQNTCRHISTHLLLLPNPLDHEDKNGKCAARTIRKKRHVFISTLWAPPFPFQMPVVLLQILTVAAGAVATRTSALQSCLGTANVASRLGIMVAFRLFTHRSRSFPLCPWLCLPPPSYPFFALPFLNSGTLGIGSYMFGGTTEAQDSAEATKTVQPMRSTELRKSFRGRSAPPHSRRPPIFATRLSGASPPYPPLRNQGPSWI